MTISSETARHTVAKFGMQTRAIHVQDHWGSHVNRGHRWEENVTFNLQLYIKLQERHIMPSR